MDIKKIISTFFFVQASKYAFELFNSVLLNKIKIKDYLTINLEKRYLRVILEVDECHNELNIITLMKNYDYTYKDVYKRLKITMIDQSIETIIRTFEDKLLWLYNQYSHRPDYIILKYIQWDYKYNQIFRKIIKQLKKINKGRKNLTKCDDIIYEYIIEQGVLCERMFPRLKFFRPDFNCMGIDPAIPITYIKKYDARYLSFCINLESIYYFFDVNVEDLCVENLFPLVEIKTEYKNEYDKTIGMYFHDLYKFTYVDDIDICTLSYFEVCTFDTLKLKDTKFEIIIENDRICITHSSDPYFYLLKDNSCSSFLNFFKKIYASDQDRENLKGVELFYRLLERDGKVEFLIHMIFNKTGSSLNIIFVHLLLEQGLIEKCESKKIIEHGQLDETKRKRLIKKIQKKLSDSECKWSICIMKICLFLEAEFYLNESDIIDESLFGSLKKIGILMKSKNNNEKFSENVSITSSKNQTFDLIRIYQEFLKHHFVHIEKFKMSIWKYIFNIASLVTGMKKNTCEILYDSFYILKEEVLTILGFNEDEITQNNYIILEKLATNSREDAKKEELKRLEKDIKDIQIKIEEKTFKKVDLQNFKNKVKERLHKLNKMIFSFRLSKFEKEALNKSVEKLYINDISTKFENELIKEGVREIEDIFKNDKVINELRETIDVVDKDLINEYKKEVKEKFYKILRINITKNVQKICKKDLTKELVTFFESSLQNKQSLKIDCGEKLEKILLKLSTDDILEIINGEIGISLNSDLLKVLEKTR
ncbi:uncharacterized protein VNE69_06096 [Vairimorpha necatrix]|uniref:Uncharacterized protein n=1 Tax=Vairimorpha necatrix TaxID=6039 RepID=A0AAX4JCT9_9MICR